MRVRRDDILVLSQHLASRAARRYNRQISLSRSALELLLGYDFPGNVRELENLVESAVAVSTENPQVIGDKDLRPLLQKPPARPMAGFADDSLSMEQAEESPSSARSACAKATARKQLLY